MAQKNQSKVEVIARITTPDGRVVEKTVEVDGQIPSLEEFDLCTREGFLRDFDKLERDLVSARDQAFEGLTKEYLNEVSKKNS